MCTSRPFAFATLSAALLVLTVSGHARTGGHPTHVVDAGNGDVYVTSAVQRVVNRYGAALAGQGDIALSGAPHGLQLDGEGTVAVVANTGGGTVDVVDLGSAEVTCRVRVGSSPVQVAVTEDGARAFVSVASTSEVVALDVRTGEITGRVKAPAAPAQILLTEEHLLVANQGSADAPGTASPCSIRTTSPWWDRWTPAPDRTGSPATRRGSGCG